MKENFLAAVSPVAERVRAIANPLNIGSGHGPVNHWAYRD